MQVLRFARGSTKPLPGALPDYAHPFMRGVLLGAAMNEYGTVASNGLSLNMYVGNGVTPRRLLAGSTLLVPEPSWGSNVGGPCIVFSDVDNGLSLGEGSAFPTDAVTVCVVQRKTDLTPRGTFLFELGSNGAGSLIKAHAPWSDGDVYFYFGTNAQVVTWTGWTPTTALMRWIFTAGPAGTAIWCNGVKVASQASVWTRATDTGNFILGNATGVTSADLQQINSIHTVNHQWSDELCRWWSAEPYAHLYAHSSTRRFFMTHGLLFGNSFKINGTNRDLLQQWSISEQLNERGTMRFGVKSMDASYRPGLRESVDLYWAGVHFFAGHIHHMDEGGLGGLGVVPIVTDCGATDFNALPDRRQVAITLPAGTLKSMLELLEPYLTAFGVTLDPAQVSGPTLVELTFAIGTLTAVLEKLSVVSEYAWEIDYNKVLRMFQPGSVATPFDIEDNDARVVGDVLVAPTTVDYVNRVIVLAGSGTSDVADTFTGDGVEDTFDLNYTLVSSYGYVTVDAVAETLGPGATWEYNELTNSITRTAGAPANLDPIVITYVAQFPFEVIAEDVPAQDGGANLHERTYPHPEVFDVVTAQALADGYLVRGLVQPREVRYRTRLSGVRSGMQQQIQVTGRNVDGPCLITAVNTTPEGSALYNYDVTAVEGLVIVQSHQSKWRDRTARSA